MSRRDSTTPSISVASDKRADKRNSAGAASVESIGVCEQPATDTQSVGAKTAELWHFTFKAADPGNPPMAVRVRRLLKTALRSHRLQCVDFSTSAGPATDGRPLPLELRGVAGGRHGVATVTAQGIGQKTGVSA